MPKRRSPSDPIVGNDPIVIAASQVAKVLRPWLDAYGCENIARQLGANGTVLAAVLKGEERWLMFKTVDRWLTGLGEQHRLSDGSLTLVANPKWSQARWVRYWNKCGDDVPDDIEFLP